MKVSGYSSSMNILLDVYVSVRFFFCVFLSLSLRRVWTLAQIYLLCRHLGGVLIIEQTAKEKKEWKNKTGPVKKDRTVNKILKEFLMDNTTQKRNKQEKT